jgi:uncharacterized protein (TIGR00251 family)
VSGEAGPIFLSAAPTELPEFAPKRIPAFLTVAGPDAAQIKVRLQPRSKRDEIVGERDGVLVVRVTAPAREGKANEALCALMARRLRIGRRRVAIVRGSSSRDKVVRIEGVTTAELRSALAAER